MVVDFTLRCLIISIFFATNSLSNIEKIIVTIVRVKPNSPNTGIFKNLMGHNKRI